MVRHLGLVATLALSNAATAIEETLQNDGFVDGSPVVFQAGFVAGEIAASRFIPTIACPCVVDSVTLLFGGASGTRTMGISIWEDAAGTAGPGSLLFSGDVELTGSNLFLQQIDLSLTAVVVNGPFRVGLEFGHDGLPAVATDLDGTIDKAANFILADIGIPFWFPASDLGVSGDFIIRATIDNLVAEDTDADGIPDVSDNCITVSNSDQRDTDGDNYGNICDADLNNDCSVNFGDLERFRTVFFGDDPDADLDGDGFVNFSDLSSLRQQFFGPPGPSGLATLCDS